MQNYLSKRLAKTWIVSAFALLFIAPQIVRAADDTLDSADDSTHAASTTSIPSKEVKNTLNISYFGVYQGPAFSHPLGGGSIDTTTVDYTEGEQNLANQFKFDYNVTNNVFVGPVLNFQVNPTYAGDAFIMLDSGVRVGNRALIHTDEANLLVDFRVMAPMKPSYRKNDEVLNLQSLQVFTYKVPKSRVTLGILGFHTFQMYGAARPIMDWHVSSSPKDLSLYFAPNISYQLSEKVSLVAYYEVYPYHKVGARWDTWTGDADDISPGVSWDITPNVNFSPQLLLYPRTGLSTEKIGTIAYLSAKIL